MCEQQMVQECEEDKVMFENYNFRYSLENIFVSEDDIRRAMSKIDTSNACGPDGLPNISALTHLPNQLQLYGQDHLNYL